MVVVTSEGLGRVDDREGRSASGDCEGDSNKYEDFSHGRILSKKYPQLYHTLAKSCDGKDKKLRFLSDTPAGLWPASASARRIGEDAVGYGKCTRFLYSHSMFQNEIAAPKPHCQQGLICGGTVGSYGAQ